MAIRVRVMTAEEKERIERAARSRTEPARMVERGKIILQCHAGQSVATIAKELHLSQPTVRLWIKRFNESGLAGLQDMPRPGHPPTYTTKEVGEVIATALTNPQRLSLPFGCWTLDRLEAYLNEVKGIAIKRTRIDDLLINEGLRWRKQETWFSERVDPDFAEKRGHHPDVYGSSSGKRSHLFGRNWARVCEESSWPRTGPKG